MKVANIRQEGVAMKSMEATVSAEEEAFVVRRRPVGDKEAALKHVDTAKVSPTLVTLMQRGAEIGPKQLAMVEQFRLLRTRVKALNKDLKLRTILVTSALPGEGKTTVAANLAGSLGRIEGLRVLLVDFDLRRPCLHTIFGVEPDKRSPSALGGRMPWQDAIYRAGTGLDILFGFQPLEEPDHLLQSSRLETLLEEFKAEYDLVVLDSAPILAVADTHSLVPLVDCGVFVLSADTTPISAAKEALTMLRDKVAGCVVNRVTRLKSEDYYRSSGYGYGHGYGSKKAED